MTAGNGGSASLASHAAQAIIKPNYKPGGGHAACCITDMTPVITAFANDGQWSNVLVESARPIIENNSRVVVLLISSSGKSENICNLASYARSKGCHVLGLTGFNGEPLKSLSTVWFHVPSDNYEIVEPVHDALIHRLQYHLRESS